MSEIIVRDAKLEDAGRILEIYQYYVEHTAISFEYETPSLAEFENRMRNIMRKYPYLAACMDGVIKGYAYAAPFVGRAGCRKHARPFLRPGYLEYPPFSGKCQLPENSTMEIHFCQIRPPEPEKWPEKSVRELRTL